MVPGPLRLAAGGLKMMVAVAVVLLLPLVAALGLAGTPGPRVLAAQHRAVQFVAIMLPGEGVGRLSHWRGNAGIHRA